jgi:hypothetical protein
MRPSASARPISAKGLTVAALQQQKLNGDASLMGQPEKGLILPIVCLYVELKRHKLTNCWGKYE